VRCVDLHLAPRGPPGVHVLDRERNPGPLLQQRDPLDEPAGVVALPPERRVHDDHVGADLVRHLGAGLELRPGIGAPHPLGDEQARRVHRAHRDAVVLREVLDLGDVLAGLVDPHHHLERVEAQPDRHLEGRRGGLRVHRRRRQRHRVAGGFRSGHRSTPVIPRH
jgi:hypothetical protein